MNTQLIVLSLLFVISSAHAMEQPQANPLATTTAQQTMKNADLHDLINSSALSNCKNIIAPYTLNKLIKDYILAATMSPAIADFKEYSLRPALRTAKHKISPDGKWLSEVGESDTVYLYNMDTAEQISCKLNHLMDYFHNNLAWSPDSFRVAVCYKHGASMHLQIFDIMGHEITINFENTSHNQFTNYTTIVWHPFTNELITYSPENDSLTAYNADTGTIIKNYALNTYNVAHLHVNATGSFMWAHPSQPLICFGNNKKQIFFDLNSANPVLLEHNVPMNASCHTMPPQLVVNPNGTQVALLVMNTDTKMYTLDIIDLAMGQTVKSTTFNVQNGNETINSVLLLPWFNQKVVSCLVNKTKSTNATRELLKAIGTFVPGPHSAKKNSCCIVSYDINKNLQFSTAPMNGYMSYIQPYDLNHDTYPYKIFANATSYMQTLSSIFYIIKEFAINKWWVKMSEHDLFDSIHLNYHLYTTDQCKKSLHFFDDAIDHSLSLSQALLLNAIGEQYIFTPQGPKVKLAHKPYDLDVESHTVFKTLPHAIQKALKPLVIEHGTAYYKTEKAYKHSGLHKLIKKSKCVLKYKAHYAWQGFKHAVQSYKDNFIRV